MLTRYGDWLATFGRSGVEKGAILAKRRAAHAANQMRKAIRYQARYIAEKLRKMKMMTSTE